MERLLKALRWMTAIATILVLLMLAWQCIDIYVTETSKDRATVESIYRMDDVVHRLSAMSFVFAAYGLLMMASALLHHMDRQGSTDRPHTSCQAMHPHAKDRIKIPLTATRVMILGISLLFIVLGVLNGGWYDVLVKAINICTECIGLG